MRKPRLEIQGGLYHVIARGNNRQLIFGSNGDFTANSSCTSPTRNLSTVYAY